MVAQAAANGADFGQADRWSVTKRAMSAGRLTQRNDLFLRRFLAHHQRLLNADAFTLAAVNASIHLQMESSSLVIFDHPQRLGRTNLRAKTT